MKRKRILLPLAFLLVFIMLLPLYGCGGNEEGEQLQEEPESEEVTIDEFFKKAEGIEDYSYDFVISDGSTGTLIEGRMWIKGKKQRLEMDSEGGKDVQIIDYEANKAYSYMPEQQMAFEIDPGEVKAPETPTDYVENTDITGAKFLSTEEVDGVKSYKFSVKPKEEDSASVIYWLHEEYGFPVKVEMTVGEAVYTIEFKNYEVGDISEDIFTLPDEVNVQSISEITQNLPADP